MPAAAGLSGWALSARGWRQPARCRSWSLTRTSGPGPGFPLPRSTPLLPAWRTHRARRDTPRSSAMARGGTADPPPARLPPRPRHRSADGGPRNRRRGTSLRRRIRPAGPPEQRTADWGRPSSGAPAPPLRRLAPSWGQLCRAQRGPTRTSRCPPPPSREKSPRAAAAAAARPVAHVVRLRSFKQSPAAARPVAVLGRPGRLLVPRRSPSRTRLRPPRAAQWIRPHGARRRAGPRRTTQQECRLAGWTRRRASLMPWRARGRADRSRRRQHGSRRGPPHPPRYPPLPSVGLEYPEPASPTTLLLLARVPPACVQTSYWSALLQYPSLPRLPSRRPAARFRGGRSNFSCSIPFPAPPVPAYPLECLSCIPSLDLVTAPVAARPRHVPTPCPTMHLHCHPPRHASANYASRASSTPRICQSCSPCVKAAARGANLRLHSEEQRV